MHDITMLIILSMVFVFMGLREYFFYVERQKLLDRIQSRDLAEYRLLGGANVNKTKTNTSNKTRDEILKEEDWL